ncbi:hypothetical protein EON68_02680, partial [archaeon]
PPRRGSASLSSEEEDDLLEVNALQAHGTRKPGVVIPLQAPAVPPSRRPSRLAAFLPRHLVEERLRHLAAITPRSSSPGMTPLGDLTPASVRSAPASAGGPADAAHAGATVVDSPAASDASTPLSHMPHSLTKYENDDEDEAEAADTVGATRGARRTASQSDMARRVYAAHALAAHNQQVAAAHSGSGMIGGDTQVSVEKARALKGASGMGRLSRPSATTPEQLARIQTLSSTCDVSPARAHTPTADSAPRSAASGSPPGARRDSDTSLCVDMSTLLGAGVAGGSPPTRATSSASPLVILPDASATPHASIHHTTHAPPTAAVAVAAATVVRRMRAGTLPMPTEALEHLHNAFERHTLNILYPSVFATAAEDVAEDLVVYSKLASMQWLSPEQMLVPEGARSPLVLRTAVQELRLMNGRITPEDKLACIVSACTVLYKALSLYVRRTSGGDGAAGADELLPSLIYATL